MLDLAFTQVTDEGLRQLATCAPALRQLTMARSHSNVWICAQPVLLQMWTLAVV